MPVQLKKEEWIRYKIRGESCEEERQGKARQGKARQGKARQGRARQGKARQGKIRNKIKEDSPVRWRRGQQRGAC